MTAEHMNDTPMMDSPMMADKPTMADQPMGSSPTFQSFDLPPMLAKALAQMNYSTPTPVQMGAIPAALAGRDVMGSAQTGTGKTGAFCIPLLARMMNDKTLRTLIMTPTRELAAQIVAVIHQMRGEDRTMRTALLIGGDSMRKQYDQLRGNPCIIVGTPGRINDHLRQDPRLMQGVGMVVLDEADRMLDMGFSVQIETIFARIATPRQTLMFSATFPQEILRFAKQYQTDPVRVSVSPTKVTAENINHETLQTSEATRYDDLVAQLDARQGSIIVFVKTKHGADRLSQRLEREKHDVDVIHGGLRQRQRDKAILAFRQGQTRVMIATDVAARGLDVPHIEHVINYDLPQNPEDYIHRIGRTARAGKTGNAVAFLMPSERGKWNAINRILNPGAKMEREESGNARGAARSGNGGRPAYRGNASRPGSRPADGRDYARPQRIFHDRPKKERANTGNEDWFNDQADQLVQLRAGEAPREERGNRDGQMNRRGHATQRREPAGGARMHDAPRQQRPDDRGGEHRRPQGDRPHNARPQGNRPQGDRTQGDRPQGDRPRSDRPQGGDGHKPAWIGKRTERSEGFRPQREGQSPNRNPDAPRGGKPEGRRDSNSVRKEGYPQRDGAPRGERPQGSRPEGDRPRSFSKGPRRNGQLDSVA